MSFFSLNPLISAYLNSEIVIHSANEADAVPILERIRGICFSPLHYFCDGRVYEGQTLEEIGMRPNALMYSYKYPIADHSILMNVKMIVLILPGMIIGTMTAVAVYVDWCFKSIAARLRNPRWAYESCWYDRLGHMLRRERESEAAERVSRTIEGWNRARERNARWAVIASQLRNP